MHGSLGLLVQGTSSGKPKALYNTLTFAKQHTRHVKTTESYGIKKVIIDLFFLINNLILPVKTKEMNSCSNSIRIKDCENMGTSWLISGNRFSAILIKLSYVISMNYCIFSYLPE